MKTKTAVKSISWTIVRLTALLAALALPAPPTRAQETKPEAAESGLRRFLERDYLFGDWWGGRSWLAKQGVDLEFLYAAAVPTSLEGGRKSGSVYEGTLLMMLDVDSAKLAGYEGGHFHVSSLALQSGRAFSRNYVGDLNQVSLLDFPDAFRLWELWYEQKLAGGKVALRLGELDIGQDFILPEYYNTLGMVTFLNQTFFFPTMAFNVWDQPYFPTGHHGLASTPYAAPGARLRLEPYAGFYVQAGVYGGNPDRSHAGTGFSLSQSEGALSYYEIGYRHNQGKHDDGPPGNIKLGGWYHTGSFVDMYEGTFNAFDNYAAAAGLGLPPVSVAPARFADGNYGAYLLVDHVLWREIGKTDKAQQGLVGFLLASAAPPDRNLAQFGLNGGLVYKGAIPSRDWDSVGLAASYLKMSDDIRRAQRDLNAYATENFGTALLPEADYEAVLEFNYRAQLAAWWSLQTSLQRVWHPGGRLQAELPDAWVFIVQTAFRF
jgi:porin